MIGLLFVGIALGLLVKHWQVQQLISGQEAEDEARERLEDKLERDVIRQLKPGSLLDSIPTYRLLIDNTVGGDHSDFELFAEYITDHSDDAPVSFVGCEFHEFIFLEHEGFETHYVVVARDRVCVMVFWAGGSMRPV